MSMCIPPEFHFHSFNRRKIEVPSGGGLLLVRQTDARLGLIKDLSQAIPDDRVQ